jgi:hypothetical protein
MLLPWHHSRSRSSRSLLSLPADELPLISTTIPLLPCQLLTEAVLLRTLEALDGDSTMSRELYLMGGAWQLLGREKQAGAGSSSSASKSKHAACLAAGTAAGTDDAEVHRTYHMHVKPYRMLSDGLLVLSALSANGIGSIIVQDLCKQLHITRRWVVACLLSSV